MFYLSTIKQLVERADVFSDRNVHVTIIANPVAGGFTMKARAKENEQLLADTIEAIQNRPIVARECSVSVQLTTHAGHAGKFAHEVLEEALASTNKEDLFLIVTAGGDGTSHDVQSSIARVIMEGNHPELADRVCILRLPYGTGNDGSDGRTLAESLSLLTEKSVFKRNSVIRVFHAGNREHPWYSFNIASVGLDAFVTHMTNYLKNKLPGDFYKLWIDLACLFYNKLYHVGSMRVHATMKDGTPILSYSGKKLLQCMGISGFRAYGSNQKILPDANNVCAISEMSMLLKLKLKGTVKSGTHSGLPQSLLYKADRIVIDYDRKILTQQDGEAHLLGKDDFPLVMELTEPVITSISKQ